MKSANGLTSSQVKSGSSRTSLAECVQCRRGTWIVVGGTSIIYISIHACEYRTCSGSHANWFMLANRSCVSCLVWIQCRVEPGFGTALRGARRGIEQQGIRRSANPVSRKRSCESCEPPYRGLTPARSSHTAVVHAWGAQWHASGECDGLPS